MPIDSIIQAGLLAFAAIIIVLFLVFSVLFAGTLRPHDPVALKEETEDDEPTEQPEEKKESLVPIYERYPQIYRFEILYWRGVSKPWWWNNYAKDLYEYSSEYFPWNKVDFYSTFNSNSKSTDPVDLTYRDRIMALRPRKRSKHPLVIINYDQEYIMVDSTVALEAMKDRIDAEWFRYYGFKKTYRNSPLYETK